MGLAATAAGRLELVTADGRTVFEVKSFGRLDSSRRRQVEKSLKKAVQSVPDMTRWVLVIPMNMTPDRPGAKSSEQAWFEERSYRRWPRASISTGTGWTGSTPSSENMDIQRFIEGPDAQVLQRAMEFDKERAVLRDGATDLDARLAGFGDASTRSRRTGPWSFCSRRRPVADAASQLTTRRSSTRSSSPRHSPSAPVTPKTRSFVQFEHTLAFGGHVDLPAGYVTDIDIDASDEARSLFRAGDPGASRFSVSPPRSARSSDPFTIRYSATTVRPGAHPVPCLPG